MIRGANGYESYLGRSKELLPRAFCGAPTTMTPTDHQPQPFRRIDESPDEEFYTQPRFVAHIDERAIAAVTQVYREYLPAGGAVLDLMSSWISHLPPEVEYSRVVGVGMNARELSANPRLTEWRVQNLNADSILPYGDAEFDGAAICVSVDYLTQPVEVLSEVGRVLKAGAPLVITFSNRCFPTKAVLAWHALDDPGRMDFVAGLLRQAGNFDQIEAQDRSSKPKGLGDPLYAVIGRAKL